MRESARNLGFPYDGMRGAISMLWAAAFSNGALNLCRAPSEMADSIDVRVDGEVVEVSDESLAGLRPAGHAEDYSAPEASLRSPTGEQIDAYPMRAPLMALQREAPIIEGDFAKAGKATDYLKYICVDALWTVEPGAVTITEKEAS